MKTIIITFFDIIVYCLKISFKASMFYSVIRFISRIINSISVITLTFLTSMIINYIAIGSADGEGQITVLVLSIFILIFSVTASLLSKVNEYCTTMHNEILTNFLNILIMEKSMEVDLGYFDSPVFYDAIEAVKKDSYSIISIVWNIFDGISSFFTVLCSLIIICQMNIFYGILMVLTIIPSTIVNQKFTKLIYNWGLGHIKEQRQLSYLQFISADKTYAMDIRLFNLNSYIKQKYSDIWNVFFHMRKKNMKKRTFYVVIFGVLPDICMWFIVLYIAISIINGNGTIGEYTLYTGILGQLSASLFYLIMVVMKIYEDRMRITNIKKVMNATNKISNNGKKKPESKICIEFKNVCFCYPDTDKMILKNISFKVDYNEKVCIVGMNGAGKSTIMKLILRFYDATSGEILINDTAIEDYNILELRKSFSSFFQNIVNYSLTLRENIILSDLEKGMAVDKEVIAALEQSDAITLLDKCPRGLDQYITKSFDEDGLELSNGQYQKLALARTFYRNCSAVLLDEPSASLDPQAEYNLFKNLEQYCKDKTILFTSHRLSNIHLADRIVFMENGAIVEAGRHEELINAGGKYAELYGYQADKFKKIVG